MAQDDPKHEPQGETAPSEGPTSVLIAVGLLGVSACYAIGGLQIRVPERWQTAPGMLPTILGISLFIMSAMLLAKAIRGGALRVRFVEEVQDSSLARAGTTFLIVGIYYFGLLALLPFEVASSVFLLAMFWLYWRDGSTAVRVATAIGLPIFITLTFKAAFEIPLPGQGDLVLLTQYLMVSH